MMGEFHVPLLAVKRAAWTSLRGVGRSTHTAIALPTASTRRRGEAMPLTLGTTRTGADQKGPLRRLAHNELVVPVSPTSQTITASPLAAITTCGACDPASPITSGPAHAPAVVDSAAVARRPATLSDWLKTSAAAPLGAIAKE